MESSTWQLNSHNCSKNKTKTKQKQKQNNINDLNHLIDIDLDRNNANLQPNCFNVEASHLLQLPLADNILCNVT